jgi:DNA-binding transcriptional LysR family regulator
MRRTAPGIEVGLRDMSTAEQIEALRAGQLDLGFVRLPVGTEFETLPVVKDRLLLVSPASSQFPEGLALKQCRNEPFIMIAAGRSPGFHTHSLLLCARHGFHPRVTQEVPEFTTALALVKAGIGVSLIPQSFPTRGVTGVRFHPLPERQAQWKVGAAWRIGDTNPILARFLALLRSELKR